MSAKRDARLKALAEEYSIEFEFLELAVDEGAVSEEELEREDRAAEQARLRRLQRLCRSLDIDAYAGAIIVDLLERLEETRRELERRRPGAEG
ncbi:MAG TPA: chaperone modulator CbpM [Elusimicrobiota bacterium]|nr:chaperone modulator CbpM [Elusimicrobiota bacterium]